jgi:hypothetical protein
MPSKTAQDRASLCSFLFDDGRQCRMLKKNKTSQFCYFHQRYADEIDDAIEAGQQIASCLTSDFVSNCSINAALSRIFISVARGDYDVKTARTLAYLAQLMSRTLLGAKKELVLSVGLDNMNRVVEYCLSRVNENFRRPHANPLHPNPNRRPPNQPPPKPNPHPAPSSTFLSALCVSALDISVDFNRYHTPSLRVGLGFFSSAPIKVQITSSGMHPMPLPRIKYQQWLFYSSPW